MTANDILVTRFARETFAASLNEASGGAGTPVPPQVEYLARYAERLHAAAVVREEVYVDRHYMDEHAAYYSRMLTPPPHTVRRFHLFEHELTQDGLAALLNEALTSSEARQHVEEALTDKYLGFVSIRPIPAAPVGRTVLRTLNEPGAQREIWALSPYDVHLANLRLCVQGLAFEQQDVAVGACATASVWSALSRVAKHEGMRAPTPAEVSAAASRHVLPHGRGMPAASGLTLGQMCEAIRSVGFAPEAMRPRMPEIFLLAVHTYLLSGIPVVLGLWNDEVGGHAVTAVGFYVGDTPNPVLQTSVQVRSASVTKLYVHDDRLGPYARARVFYRPQVTAPDGEEIDEALLLGIDTEVWSIDSGVAPVYPKLRLPVSSLVTLAELMAPSMEAIVGADSAASLNVEFQYKRAGDYLRDLSGRVGGSGAVFLRTVVLPRWCGIVRWFLQRAPIAEFVYDTTDVLRDGRFLGRELLRAVVCLAPQLRADLRQLAGVLSVPALPD